MTGLLVVATVNEAFGNGGGGAALLPFSDDFERVDGDLGNGWEYTAGKWTIASGAALGTPALGANLVANSGFDSDTSWFKTSGWTISGGTGNKVPDAGFKEIRQAVLTAGKWYRVVWTITVRNAGTFRVFGQNNYTPRAAAATYLDCFRPYTTSLGVEGDAASDGSIDNVTAQLLTLADQFCARDLGSSDIEISAPLVVVKGTEAGIVACLDSITTPANFLIATHNGTNAILTKCVGGTYTQLITGAAAYADGREISIIKNGTDASLYYNGVQIGTTQTVSDAGIINNTLHGLFTTCTEDSFGSFSAVNP